MRSFVLLRFAEVASWRRKETPPASVGLQPCECSALRGVRSVAAISMNQK